MTTGATLGGTIEETTLSSFLATVVSVKARMAELDPAMTVSLTMTTLDSVLTTIVFVLASGQMT